jgi:hypothetical protein
MGGWRVSGTVSGEALLGWRFTISVPQPNGCIHHRMWILAIPDEGHARQKLLLTNLPAEAEAAPLSPDELAHFGLEPGEVRRVL